VRLEVHVLQNFAPSNLNRDDTGSPKDAEFGGHRRARISSQCIKRAVRRYFEADDLMPKAHRGERTKRLAKAVAEYLTAVKKRPEAAATAAAQAGVTAFLAKSEAKDDGDHKTPYLLFLGQSEITRFADLVDQHFEAFSAAPAADDKPADDAKTKKGGKKKKDAEGGPKAPDGFAKAVEKLLDGGKAADLALFGRMLADLPENNVDAACQVAHAISTNKIHSMEMDYYTAVDDLKPDDTAGADMIGTVEFNSACFYRYANLDLGQLAANLQGDTDLARKTVEAFLTATVHAVPTGKQNSFAAHNPPSLVFAVVRSGPPVSLANAFVKPVWPGTNGNLVTMSVEALDGYYGRVTKMYGDGGRTAAAVCCLDDVELSALKAFRQDSVAEVISTAVAAAFGKGAA
jgi:CRISPR system Cascade subunit CasC